MTEPRDKPFLFALLVLGAALFANAVVASWRVAPPAPPPANQGQQQNAPFAIVLDAFDWVEKHNGAITAVATVVITLFTWTLWLATREQIRANRAQERAFVFPKDIQIIEQQLAATEKTVSYAIAIQWRNSGSTPTRNMFARVSLDFFPKPMDDDFAFPDIGDDKTARLMLGPGAELDSVPLQIYPDIFTLLQKGHAAHGYLWGWAEYNDIYRGTPRHRTEFCYKLRMTGDFANLEKVSFGYSLHHKHNGADEECMKPLTTTGLET